VPLPLASVIAALEALAPLALAASWDNVGLLVEPPPGRDDVVRRVLLTIDLGERELDEALASGCELVVAYHPPIFQPLSRLTRASAAERIVLRAVAHRVALYSPHTALDAVPGGVNDWLLQAFGDRAREVRALSPAPDPEGARASGGGAVAGAGRLAVLDPPLGLEATVAAVKRHLGLEHVRLAAAERHAAGEPIRSVAVCPGAGGSLFADVRGADLLWTGELRHHDVRAHNAAGASVILCDHTNTERGYLPLLAERLRARLDGAVEVTVSARDRDPLDVV